MVVALSFGGRRLLGSSTRALQAKQDFPVTHPRARKVFQCCEICDMDLTLVSIDVQMSGCFVEFVILGADGLSTLVGDLSLHDACFHATFN